MITNAKKFKHFSKVRKWGINVHSVKLSEAKILKQPESGSNAAVGSILKGLGMKNDAKYPSPSEFVRATHGFEEQQPTASMLGSFSATDAQVNMNLLQSLSSSVGAGGAGAGLVGGGAATNNMQLGPGIVAPPTQTPPEEFPANWGRCLEVILSSEFGPGTVLEPESHGLYRLEITETEAGKDVYYIELSATKRGISKTDPSGGREPDVSVVVSSPDLAAVLQGQLAPLQAYLTGRISATGDVRKLVFFDRLARKGGHRPGSMFTV